MVSNETDRNILEGARLQALRIAGKLGFAGLEDHIKVHAVNNSPMPNAWYKDQLTPITPCLSYKIMPFEREESGEYTGDGASVYVLRDPVGDKRFTVYAVAFEEDNRFFELPVSFEANSNAAMEILGMQLALAIVELHLCDMDKEDMCPSKFVIGEFHQHWDD